MNSPFGKLNLADLFRGLVVAVLTAVLTLVVELLKAKGFSLTSADGSQILSTAVLSLLGYLSKNLLTNADGLVLGKF